MEGIRVVSRAEGRQAAAASAFDGFHERRSRGGIDLTARRNRIDAVARVAGSSTDHNVLNPVVDTSSSIRNTDDDVWRVPSRDELPAKAIRGSADRATAESRAVTPGTRVIDAKPSGFRERVTGAIGGIFRRRDRNPSPDLSAGGAGVVPSVEPPGAPPADPVPEDDPDATPRTPPIPEPNPAPRQPDDNTTSPAVENDTVVTDPWEVPDLERFAQLRSQRNEPPGAPPADPVPEDDPDVTLGTTPPNPDRAIATETGSWVASLKDRVAGARRRVGEMMSGAKDAGGAMVDVAKGRIEAAKAWAERKADTPLGKAVLKAAEQVAKDIAEGKRRGKGGMALQFAKYLGLYGVYKAKEIVEEKKWDIATGVATGAAVRPLLLMIGVETYFASAGIAFTTGAVRKGISELDNYVSPEADGTRKSLVGKIRALNSTQRKEIATKMLIAGSISGVSSFAGAGLMHWTGLDVMMKDVAHSGMNKVSGAFAGLKESLPQGTGGIPGLDSVEASSGSHVGSVDTSGGVIGPPVPPTIETGGVIVDSPGSLPSVPGSVETPGAGVQRPGVLPPVSGSVDTSGVVVERSGVLPAQQVSVPEAVAAQPAPGPSVVEAIPPVPKLDPIEQVVDRMSSRPLPKGSTPWAIAEQLLKEANPNAVYTPADIMAVDKALVLAQVDPLTGEHRIAVPEWGIQGKILHSKLPAGMNFEITDEVKAVLKQVSKK